MSKTNDSYVIIRMSEELKRNFEAFCDSCGMTVSGAVSLLVREVIKRGELPFQVKAAEKGMRSMPVLEETVREMDAQTGNKLRISVRIGRENRAAFKEVCDQKLAGVGGMSRVIKMFMVSCINSGKMPF